MAETKIEWRDCGARLGQSQILFQQKTNLRRGCISKLRHKRHGMSRDRDIPKKRLRLKSGRIKFRLHNVSPDESRERFGNQMAAKSTNSRSCVRGGTQFAVLLGGFGRRRRASASILGRFSLPVDVNDSFPRKLFFRRVNRKVKYLFFLLALIAIGLLYETARSAEIKTIARFLFLLLVAALIVVLVLSGSGIAHVLSVFRS
jgi:hypothetical protein